jgi:hypothetical protein
VKGDTIAVRDIKNPTATLLALCAEVFPEEVVPPRARLVLEDVFGDE